MRKLLAVLVAAVCCFSSCSKEECEAIYMINTSIAGESSSTTSAEPEVEALIKEYTAALIDFEKKNTSAWEWKTWIKDNNYSKADKEAQKKFDTYAASLKTIVDTYQAKFNKCPGTLSSFHSKPYIRLSRVSSKSAEISKVQYEVKFNVN